MLHPCYLFFLVIGMSRLPLQIARRSSGYPYVGNQSSPDLNYLAD
jgi:hypothetical protein